MASTIAQHAFGWNGYADNFSIVFNELLKQREMVDVTLVADGYMFHAHRLVLSALSPYFRQVFAQAPLNQPAYVFMKGVSTQTMADLMTFIYNGEVNVDSNSLADFLQSAKELEITGLSDIVYQQSSVQVQPMRSSSYDESGRHGEQFQTTRINSVHRVHCSKTAKKDTDSADAYEFPYQLHSNGSTIRGNDFNSEHSSRFGDETRSFGMETNGDENYGCDSNNYDSAMGIQWNIEYDNDLSNDNETAVKVSNNGLSTTKCARNNNNDAAEFGIVADIRANGCREYLFINKYIFVKQGKPNARNQQRWRCNKCNLHKCCAAAYTMDVDGIAMMKINIADHTHEPAEWIRTI